MHIIKALNKTFENKGIYTAKDTEGKTFSVHKGESDDGEFIRICKDGHMIEIPLDIEFKEGYNGW